MFLITWILAAIADAFMDTITYRLDRSIFKHKNADVWNPMRSGTLMKPWLGWMRMDPWHIAKLFRFTMLICTELLYRYKPLFGYILDGIMLVLVWFIFFELFWSKIFYKNR